MIIGGKIIPRRTIIWPIMRPGRTFHRCSRWAIMITTRAVDNNFEKYEIFNQHDLTISLTVNMILKLPKVPLFTYHLYLLIKTKKVHVLLFNTNQQFRQKMIFFSVLAYEIHMYSYSIFLLILVFNYWQFNLSNYNQYDAARLAAQYFSRYLSNKNNSSRYRWAISQNLTNYPLCFDEFTCGLSLP